MPATIENKDLRLSKTNKALRTAMSSLLKKRNFKRITVMDICEEAQISRATFYAHFSDKYILLKDWIEDVWPTDITNTDEDYGDKERKINQFVYENRTMIKNLFMDADSWTQDAVFDALHSILNLTISTTKDGASNPEYIVLSNFYIGGMIHYVYWQVKNNFPSDIPVMNGDLFKVVKTFQNWNSADRRGR